MTVVANKKTKVVRKKKAKAQAKPKPKKKSNEELDALTKRIDQWDESDSLARGLGTHVAQLLQNKWPNDTHHWAIAIAQMLIGVEDDKGSRHGCRDLLMQWMLEHYTGMLVMKAMLDIHNVHDTLRGFQYTQTDPLIFNDLDNEAWWIPAEGKKVFVMQSQCRLKLVIMDSNLIMDKVHVRRLWYKFDEGRNSELSKFKTLKWFKDHDWEPGYGDCRDDGYVLSYERMTYGKGEKQAGKVDRGNHYEPQQFLDDIRWTSLALDEQTDRLSKLHDKKAGK